MFAGESATTVTIVDSTGKRQVIQRDEIDEIFSSNKSLMPDGFEKVLSQSDIAGRARVPRHAAKVRAASPQQRRHGVDHVDPRRGGRGGQAAAVAVIVADAVRARVAEAVAVRPTNHPRPSASVKTRPVRPPCHRRVTRRSARSSWRRWTPSRGRGRGGRGNTLIALPNGSPITVNGVPFTLVNPQEGAVKNVLLFGSDVSQFSQDLPTTVTLAEPAWRPRRSTCSAASASAATRRHADQSTSLTVRLHYQGGATGGS